MSAMVGRPGCGNRRRLADGAPRSGRGPGAGSGPARILARGWTGEVAALKFLFVAMYRHPRVMQSMGKAKRW